MNVVVFSGTAQHSSTSPQCCGQSLLALGQLRQMEEPLRQFSRERGVG